MSDIAGVIKNEIARLSKRSIRQYLTPVQSATRQNKKQLAALRKQIEQLQRQVTALSRHAARSGESAPALEEPKPRFVAKGLKSMRTRLDLSAEDLGRLLDVSAQTIYNWESKKTTPRAEQVAAISALRGIGKREIKARLQALSESA